MRIFRLQVEVSADQEVDRVVRAGRAVPEGQEVVPEGLAVAILVRRWVEFRYIECRAISGDPEIGAQTPD